MLYFGSSSLVTLRYYNSIIYLRLGVSYTNFHDALNRVQSVSALGAGISIFLHFNSEFRICTNMIPSEYREDVTVFDVNSSSNIRLRVWFHTI
jgi:hypothetical protein